MAISKDPEGIEVSALHALVDVTDLDILEVGCGDGRLTWGYAGRASHVTAIDPDTADIEKARADTPGKLERKITLIETSLEDFAASSVDSRFDLVIFSWSL